MIRKKVKHIYFKSFIDNADIINTHNYFTSYSEFFMQITIGIILYQSINNHKGKNENGLPKKLAMAKELSKIFYQT